MDYTRKDNNSTWQDVACIDLSRKLVIAVWLCYTTA
jgi:hypothetical protein